QLAVSVRVLLAEDLVHHLAVARAELVGGQRAVTVGVQPVEVLVLGRPGLCLRDLSVLVLIHLVEPGLRPLVLAPAGERGGADHQGRSGGQGNQCFLHFVLFVSRAPGGFPMVSMGSTRLAAKPVARPRFFFVRPDLEPPSRLTGTRRGAGPQPGGRPRRACPPSHAARTPAHGVAPRSSRLSAIAIAARSLLTAIDHGSPLPLADRPGPSIDRPLVAPLAA